MEEEPAARRACRHFARGFCFYGASCRQVHDATLAEQTAARERQLDEADLAVQACTERINTMRKDGVPCDLILAAVSELRSLKEARKLAAGPRSARRKPQAAEERAGIFRHFLLETFGLELLRGGRGVLDVAGGHGSLSFELENIDQVPCTIIDPRRVERGFGRLERKWKMLGGTQLWSSAQATDEMTAAVLAWHSANGPAGEEAAAAPPPAIQTPRARMLASRRVHLDWKAASERRPQCCQPRHWRLMWEPALFENLPPREGLPRADLVEQLASYASRIDALLQEARGLEWTRKGLVMGGSDADDDWPREVEAASSVEEGAALAPAAAGDGGVEPLSSPTASEVCSTLADCSLVAGMHADGATEGIVDFALRNRKPFAVVPWYATAIECVVRSCSPSHGRPRHPL